MTDVPGRVLDRIAQRFWARHANPHSVWLFPLAYLSLIRGLYRRDRTALSVTLALVAVHPLVFPPPDDDRAWGTRLVRGERVWLADGLRSSPLDLLLLLVGVPLNLFTLRAAVRQQPVETVVGATVTVASTVLFFHRMTRLDDQHEGASPDG